MFFVFGKIYAERVLFFKILVASLFVNILALATPIYVIQVLQRYVAYGVISTLITLFVGIIFMSLGGKWSNIVRNIDELVQNLAVGTIYVASPDQADLFPQTTFKF